MSTKVCSGCKKEKDTSCFFKAARLKDGLQARCKDCANDYYKEPGVMKKYVSWGKRGGDKNAKLLDEYKANLTCACCGENDRCCLEFHHVDPTTKFKAIVEMTRRYSWKRTLEEIQKCVCVCSNCHKKIHAGRIDCPPQNAAQV